MEKNSISHRMFSPICRITEIEALGKIPPIGSTKLIRGRRWRNIPFWGCVQKTSGVTMSFREWCPFRWRLRLGKEMLPIVSFSKKIKLNFLFIVQRYIAFHMHVIRSSRACDSFLTVRRWRVTKCMYYYYYYYACSCWIIATFRGAFVLAQVGFIIPDWIPSSWTTNFRHAFVDIVSWIMHLKEEKSREGVANGRIRGERRDWLVWFEERSREWVLLTEYLLYGDIHHHHHHHYFWKRPFFQARLGLNICSMSNNKCLCM